MKESCNHPAGRRLDRWMTLPPKKNRRKNIPKVSGASSARQSRMDLDWPER